MGESTGGERPDPRAVRDAAALVAALRQLRTWAGEPSLRRLTALAGQRRLRDGHLVDALPSSTLSDNLNGRRLPNLPRQSFVTAFVAACMRARHCSDEEIAAELQQWRQTMRRLEATAPSEPRPDAAAAAWGPILEGQTSPWHPDQPAVEMATGDAAQQSRGTSGAARALRRVGATKVYAAAVGLLVLVVAVGVVIAAGRDNAKTPGTSAADAPSAPPSSAAAAAATPSQSESASPSRGLPAAGWYLVQPGHTRHLNFCWGEGRERNGNTNRPLVVQRPCAEAMRTRLVPLGGGVYRLEWQSPENGLGCLSVDYGDKGTQPGALLAPRDCDFGGNRFRLEPYAGGHRLRPVHSGLCVGSVYGARDIDAGAEAMQERCSGGADQWFAFTAAD